MFICESRGGWFEKNSELGVFLLTEVYCMIFKVLWPGVWYLMLFRVENTTAELFEGFLAEKGRRGWGLRECICQVVLCVTIQTWVKTLPCVPKPSTGGTSHWHLQSRWDIILELLLSDKSFSGCRGTCGCCVPTLGWAMELEIATCFSWQKSRSYKCIIWSECIVLTPNQRTSAGFISLYLLILPCPFHGYEIWKTSKRKLCSCESYY